MKGPQIPLEKPALMGFWRYIKMYWLARLRLSESAVCVMSSDQGAVDYHDYPDTKEKQPDHFILLECERCGKEFTM